MATQLFATPQIMSRGCCPSEKTFCVEFTQNAGSTGELKISGGQLYDCRNKNVQLRVQAVASCLHNNPPGVVASVAVQATFHFDSEGYLTVEQGTAAWQQTGGGTPILPNSEHALVESIAPFVLLINLGTMETPQPNLRWKAKINILCSL